MVEFSIEEIELLITFTQSYIDRFGKIIKPETLYKWNWLKDKLVLSKSDKKWYW